MMSTISIFSVDQDEIYFPNLNLNPWELSAALRGTQSTASKQPAARYYNTICMLKRWPPVVWMCFLSVSVFVCVSTSAGCVADGAASPAIVSEEGRLLAFNPLLTNLISRGS